MVKRRRQIDGLDTKKKIMLLPSGKHTKNYEGVKNWVTYRNPPKTLKSKIRSKNSDKLVGGLEHVAYFSIYWECHQVETANQKKLWKITVYG